MRTASLGVLGREDVDRVAPHAERAAGEVGLVALVLHVDQLRDAAVALIELVAAAAACSTIAW
jgi:hypothetical protein